jgi:2-phosphoglycerate kinase
MTKRAWYSTKLSKVLPLSSLPHVLWLGGSACAGKSTAARVLAATYGLTLYSCDERFEEHRRRASPDRHPYFHRLMDLPPEALWAPPVATQVRDLLRFYEDEFTMVVEDLREISGSVIAEGVGLLPALVAEILAEPHRACWLISTPEFRRRHYPQRGLAELLDGCLDPRRAYDVWMDRDDEIASRLAAGAAARSLPYLVVNGSTTEAEIVSALARQFRLAD